MENEIIQINEKPTLWKWYFGWHPRVFLTAPIFLFFAYQGLWYIVAEINDVIFIFNNTPVTWGAVFLLIIFGTFLFALFVIPIYICFYSIDLFYEINIGNETAWKKFLYSIGIILLVIFGPGIIRLFTLWMLGVL